MHKDTYMDYSLDQNADNIKKQEASLAVHYLRMS